MVLFPDSWQNTDPKSAQITFSVVSTVTSNSNSTSQSPTVRSRRNQRLEISLLNRLLERESLADLFILEAHDDRVWVTSTMPLNQHGSSLLVAILVDEPSWRFGNEGQWNQAQYRGEKLK